MRNKVTRTPHLSDPLLFFLVGFVFHVPLLGPDHDDRIVLVKGVVRGRRNAKDLGNSQQGVVLRTNRGVTLGTLGSKFRATGGQALQSVGRCVLDQSENNGLTSIRHSEKSIKFCSYWMLNLQHIGCIKKCCSHTYGTS